MGVIEILLIVSLITNVLLLFVIKYQSLILKDTIAETKEALDFYQNQLDETRVQYRNIMELYEMVKRPEMN